MDDYGGYVVDRYLSGIEDVDPVLLKTEHDVTRIERRIRRNLTFEEKCKVLEANESPEPHEKRFIDRRNYEDLFL